MKLTNKSFTIRGTDGNSLSVSETSERDQIVVSIQQNDDKARIATVRLDKPQFEALISTRYELDLQPAGDPEREL